MLASLSLMAMLMFATVALAQEEDGGQRALTGDIGADEGGLGQPRVVTSAEATGGDTTSTATSTATATTSPTATTTATASPTATATASPTATATDLAKTGGLSLALPITLIASLLLIGSGITALVLLRRSFHAEE